MPGIKVTYPGSSGGTSSGGTTGGTSGGSTIGIPQQKDILTPNSKIDEVNQWEDDIYLIDEQDYVHGGKDGYDNVPHQQLANRTKFLKSTCEKLRKDLTDFQNAVKAQDTANTNDSLVIHNMITNIRTDLDNLKSVVDANDANAQAAITNLQTAVANLITQLANHKHKYAGSDTYGGDANTVKVLVDNASKLLLTGTTGANPNCLYRTSNVYIQNDEVTARQFNGKLNGDALTAKKLTSKTQITYYNDVIGSYLFDGSSPNISVKMSLNTTGVTADTYGNNASHTLTMSESFVVPKFAVNSKGQLTHAEDIVLKLPDEAVSGTTNATQKGGKLYLIGGKHQNPKEFTYSNNKAYMIDGTLYSNDRQVINTHDTQSLWNKTYEGYTLKEACSRDVETNTQGVNGSNKLVTSDALFNHQHKYAGSDTYGGDANTVKLTLNDTNKRFLTVNQGFSGPLEYNDEAYIEGNDLTVPVVHATDIMHIPGGKVWIDTSVNAKDGGVFNPAIVKWIQEIQKISKLFSGFMGSDMHKGKLAGSLASCDAGTILSYSAGGYVLADNTTQSTSTNVVIALTDSDTSKNVWVSQVAIFETNDFAHDGEMVYLDKNGQTTFTRPKTVGEISKRLGYMENQMFVFNGAYVELLNK